MAAQDVSYRSFRPDADLPRLVRLLEGVEAADQSGRDVSEAEVAVEMSYAGHDPAQDRFVAESAGIPDAIIGFGAIYKSSAGERADVQLFVHPDYRRRGIASTLLSRLLDRAHQLGARTLGINADARHPAASAFLSAHDFAPVSAYTRLHASGRIIPPLVVWPAGYSARLYDREHDFNTLLDGFNRCYAGLWGHSPVTAEELATWLPDFQPEGIFFAVDRDGQLVGMVRGETSERLSAQYGASTLNIDAPGVVPECRNTTGVDLYVPLLVTAWRWARERSPQIVQLESWGDDPRTVRRYQQLGFAPVIQRTSYRRDVDPHA